MSHGRATILQPWRQSETLSQIIIMWKGLLIYKNRDIGLKNVTSGNNESACFYFAENTKNEIK